MVVGEIAGVYGVKGWLRIRSFTEPLENILAYRPWRIGAEGAWSEAPKAVGRRHGRGLIVSFEGVTERDAASRLVGKLIAVSRAQLPDSDGEFYWADLEGLKVETSAGRMLGTVDHLVETGANDVLVVKGERQRLIPFLRGRVVLEVDLQAGRIVVDWDPDF